MPRAAPPAPHYPTFGPRPRGSGLTWLLVLLVLAAIVAVAALLGWWFVPFLAGLVIGLAAGPAQRQLRTTLPAAAAVAAAGWGVAVWWQVLHGSPYGAVARVIAALAGLPPHAAVAIVVTLLVAVIQAVVGLWLGRTLTPRSRNL